MIKSIRTVSLFAGALPALMLTAVAGSVSAADAPAKGGDAPVFEQPPAGTTNFTGKWMMAKHITHLMTSDGKEPPLNDAGKKEYENRQKLLKAGDKKVDPLSDCLMHGMPRLLYSAHPFLILQTVRNISFVHEVNHTYRIIYWDAKPPEDPDGNWLGYPTAHLDGKTLVIDSIGFNDKTWLDYSGLPHGEKLKIQERYTLASPDTIQGVVNITDPQFYSKPWSTSFTLKKQPDMNIKENVCIDTHQM
jgi:hypothetical protein